MDLSQFTEVDDFLDVAGGFLAAREAEHNLIFGITANLRDAPEAYTGAPYLAAVRDGDRVVAAAIQTPPFRVVLSEIDDPAAIDLLAADLVDRDLPGVTGPVAVARAFVEARGRARRSSSGPRDLGVHLSADGRPPSAAGRWRARGSPRLTIATCSSSGSGGSCARRWTRTTRPRSPPMSTAGSPAVAGRSTSGRTARPCRCAGSAARRRMGSASGRSTRRRTCAVAATRVRWWRPSARPSSTPAGRFVFLFTDLANPTANHIYQAIGYEAVRDIDAWRFERA